MVNVNDIKIDKQNGDLCFNDEHHVYWNTRDPNRKYTSCTTLIGMYHPKFNSEFWSRKKAMDRILEGDPEKAKQFKTMVKLAKAWHPRFNESFGVTEEQLLLEKDVIEAEWKAINLESTTFGTAFHLKKEHEWYGKNGGSMVANRFGISGEFAVQKDDYRLEQESVVIPEFLIYYSCPDGIVNLAGQVDILVKRGNDILVGDWKTNRDGIKKTAFFDQTTKKSQTMFYPINNLLDTTYNHYNLQLSIYAWMLQKINPNFNIKLLRLIHVDRNEKETIFDVEYLKDDVTRLLKHYKKQLIMKKRVEDVEFNRNGK